MIRNATALDLPSVNKIYQKVNFLSSSLDDTIVVAEIDGKTVGLGRIVGIDEKSCELGGMYVDKEYRNRGIARQIFSKLVENALLPVMYCIPFEHLQNFYKSFGFKEVVPDDTVPIKIKEKLAFCKVQYREKTLLLRLLRDDL